MGKRILAAMLLLAMLFLFASCKEVSVTEKAPVLDVQGEPASDAAKDTAGGSPVAGEPNAFFETEQISL